MAQVVRREIIVLEDDLDGKPADETVAYGLDGVPYEIDLSTKNAEKLRAAFGQFIPHSRRLGRGAAAAKAHTQRKPARNDKEQNKAIRAWAKRKGKPVSDKGRIPQEIVNEYHAEAGRGNA